MKRNLSLDTNQIYRGDCYALALVMNSEGEDKPGKVFHEETPANAKAKAPKSLYLVFYNPTANKRVLIEYQYSLTNSSSKLQLVSPSGNELFQRIAPETVHLPDLSTEPEEIRLSFAIEHWNLPGNTEISAFIDTSNRKTVPTVAPAVDFPLVNLNIKEPQTNEYSRGRQPDEVLNVSLKAAGREPSSDQLLWMLIRSRTLDFNRYRAFMDLVLCSDKETNDGLGDYRSYAEKRYLPFNRAASYSMLKFATEYYLMQECGLVPPDGTTPISQDVLGDAQRTGRSDISGITINQLRNDYLDQLEGESRTLPYFKLIRDKLSELPLKSGSELPDACYGILQSRLTSPPLLELIWSYWHEEGGLVQTMNALSLRFQNVRQGADRDPLANLAIDPLRPLSNLFWGYIEDERNRLTINRRNLEYQYEYGISLIGKAIQNIPVAEHRTNFLRGFHELLRAAVEFYQQANFTTVIPDGFPILNHLREVHLMLAEGAHNQYGDLPWVSRIEMLTQQWMLARSEVREFLGGRIMVPYTEPWMDRVDNMKQLQGWNPTNITHFRDLGVFGEQLLLSIRYGNWNDPTLGGQNAANWAHYWRAEIQRYIHAYKAVTGIDLAADIIDTRISLPANEERYLQPSQLIERQVAMRQNGQIRPQPISGATVSRQLSSNGQLIPNGQSVRKEFNG